MRYRIYPARRSVPSARKITRALRGLMIKRVGSRYRRKSNHILINWGSTDIPYRPDYNQPEAVAVSSNKLRAFNKMQDCGVRIPAYTTDKQVANSWSLVVVRRLLTGFGGRGITVVAPETEALPDAPLYTEYVPKRDEYRVHVFRGRVLMLQRKARSYSHDNPNWRIRNHGNGFVFAHVGVVAPDDVTDQAVKAVNCLGLDFGAVDVVWNERRSKAYVLEVNTAPGVEGETLIRYERAFRNG